MKICILSMQMIENFGSLLQAYNLKKIINELGHEVKFINIKEGKIKQGIKIKENPVKSELNNKFDKYILNKIKIKIKEKEQIKLFNNFRNNILNIDKSDDDKIYDLCIIGSDEVFNCIQESPWGLSTQLFGDVKNAKKVITYAASCGSTKYELLSERAKELIIKSLKNIEMFSVRDNNTGNFLEKFGYGDVNFNLDPVLVGNMDKEIEKAANNINIEDNICVVYSYKNRINSSEEIKLIKEFCKKNNLKIVTIGGAQKWTPNTLALSPFEALAYIKAAKFIITDTFHGTIFAAKYNGHFATLYRKSNYNKLSDLAKKLHIENHVIDSFSDLNKVYNEKSSKDKVNEIIQIERQNTINYLSSCLRK